MSEQAENLDEFVEDVEVTEDVDQEAENISDDITPEEIERATRQGWTDKENFKGDPERWVDARTFLKRGEEYLPIVKAANKRLEEKIDRQQETFDRFVKFQQEKEKRLEKEAYERGLAEARQRQMEAFNTGDEEAFKKARADEEAIRKKVQPETPQEQPTGNHPDWEPWLRENSWYQQDEEAGVLADYYGQQILKTNPTLQGRAFFDAVKAKVKTALPHKFENPNRSRAPQVEGAGGRKQKPAGKTYSDLPADAKKACDEFVATIPGYTKEQYLKDFDWSNV